MSEDRIKKALDFIQNDKIKGVSFDDKVQYLKTKLTEEELSEALVRLKNKDAKEANSTSSNTVDARGSVSSTSSAQVTPYQSEAYQPAPYQPPAQRSGGGSSLMNAVNIGAISAVSSIGISYLINNMKDKKEKEVFQCMKDFQEQSITSLQNKINELTEENTKLKNQVLTEADVKMIISKTLDTRKLTSDEDSSGRRNSQSLNEPISLQIKGNKGRFLGGLNNKNNNRQSLAASNSSEEQKNSTSELCESMNKFLKHAQENNCEVMREMKVMNQNMSSCFTTLSLALNKLSNKLGSDDSAPSKPTLPHTPTYSAHTPNVGLASGKMTSLATSSSIKGNQEEVKKQSVPGLPLASSQTPSGESTQGNPEQATEKIEEEKEQLDTDPKIEEEGDSSLVDDVLKIGAEVNKAPEVSEEPPAEHVPFDLSKVEPAFNEFASCLETLSPEDKKLCLSRLCSIFSTMKNQQAKGNFKINLSNKMFVKITENKKEEFLKFITELGFIEKGKDIYEAGNPDDMKSILNGDLIQMLRDSFN